jgi:hypothetical protein
MARGRGNQNSPGSARGGGRGFQGADGRGGRGGRGRGRGGGGGRGRGRGGSAPYEDALDFPVIWNGESRALILVYDLAFSSV